MSRQRLTPAPLPAGRGVLLRNLPKEFRWIAAAIMLTLAIGYGHAMGYVYLTTGVVPKGIDERFRGTSQLADTSSSAALPSEELEDTTVAETAATATPSTVTGEIEYQKSLAEMLNIIHTHILSMTFLFALSGIITLLTARTGTRFKKFVVIEPFIGIIVTFAGLWLTRYVHPAFSWLVAASGITMAACFVGQCWAVIRELRISSEL